MTIKELIDELNQYPNDFQVKILSQSISYKRAELAFTEIESIYFDDNNDMVYIEIGEI